MSNRNIGGSKFSAAELERYKSLAQSRFMQSDPTLCAMVSGTAMSPGRGEKILAMLEEQFASMMQAANMPLDPTLDGAADALINLYSHAQLYLLFDICRPAPGWSISAKKREHSQQIRETLDSRAWLAVLFQKQWEEFESKLPQSSSRPVG